LRNWSYYQLQQFIEYKAKKYGIEVRKVNPYHTSQICSKCGHWEERQRDRQDHFLCKECGYEVNADFNASRNIAKSTNFVD
jgi:transposase